MTEIRFSIPSVSLTCPPIVSETSVMSNPFRARYTAELIPAGPPPITTQSFLSSVMICSFDLIRLCFFSFFGLYYYTNALKIGRYGFVTPFVSTASIFSFLTALLFFNEEVSIYNLSSFGLLTVGILYHQKDQLKDFKLNKEILLSLLCAFFWGVSFVLYLIPIKKFGVLNFSLILEVCVFLSSMGILIYKEKKLAPRLLSKRSMKLSLIIGLLVTGGNITAHYVLDNMPIIINIVVALIFEAIMLVVGIKIFKEKFLIKDWVLIIIITLATSFVLF